MYAARPLRSVRRLQNLTSTAQTWWRIENKKSSGEPSLVSIYDEIGFYGVSAQNFLAELAGVDGDLDVHINSPGGDVFDAIAIYNSLKNRRGTVSVTIDGLAASAASFIAQAASPGRLVMAPFSTMMIHDGFAQGIGNAADMRELADQLDAASDNIAAIYAARTGKPADYWRNKMKTTTWYKDQEAVADGLADSVGGGEDNTRNAWDLSVFNAKKKAKSKKPKFDPDKDGDDDSTPEGDTDHDFFNPDGTPKKGKKAPKGNKSSGKMRNADVDNSPWDASKAWSNGAKSDNPEAFYRAICAGEKTTGEPGTQAHWALPYRYTPDSPPNAAGVRNAMSRLSQTHDLKDPDAVKSKLQSLMKKVNPDYEPGDKIDTRALAAVLGDALKGVK